MLDSLPDEFLIRCRQFFPEGFGIQHIGEVEDMPGLIDIFLDLEEFSVNEIVERHVRMDTAGSVLPDRETAGIYDGAYALYSSYLEAVKPLYV